MKPVTERDVARLIGGEIDDPLEARRILDAIDADPDLGELAEFLSGEFDEEETELSTLPFKFPNLSKTQLGRMCTPIRDLTAGSTGRSLVEYGCDGQLANFELSWRIDGQAIQFEAPWPSDLRPIGLVLAQFKLVRDTIPFHSSIKLPPLPKPAPEKTARGETPVPRTAAAQTTIGLADTRGADTLPEAKAPSYCVECSNNQLYIGGPLREGRDEELVLAEVYAHKDSSTPMVRVPVTLTREKYSALGSAVVKDFPWPTERASDTVYLKIVPLDAAGIPLLSGSQVSGLLESDDEFTAIPILPDGSGQLTAFLDTTRQRTAFRDEACTWFVRMEQGGDA